MQHPSSASQTDLFVIACEPSGDLLGSLLLKDFFSLHPSCKVTGVCGQEMRKLPLENILDAESLSVMGFIDVARSFWRLSRLFFQVKREILQRNPRVLLLIDAPSFNLKMAKALKKAGYKGTIIQYVCPTIWAWKNHRKKTMVSYLDILVPLFPFEKDLLNDTPLKTYFFGHPLHQMTTSYSPKKDPEYITLFPGSRPSVIQKNLPIQIAAAQELSNQFQLPIQIVAAHQNAEHQIAPYIDPSIRVVPHHLRYEAMQNTQLALATSGTITLELCLCKVPTLVNYVIRPFDEWLATKIFRINLPFYCIVNLLLKREVYPEYYGSRLDAAKHLAKAQEILLQGDAKQLIEKGCEEIQQLLCPPSAEKTFPDLLSSLLTQKPESTDIKY